MEIERTELANWEYKTFMDIMARRRRIVENAAAQLVLPFPEPVKEHSECEGSFMKYDSEGRYIEGEL